MTMTNLTPNLNEIQNLAELTIQLNKEILAFTNDTIDKEIFNKTLDMIKSKIHSLDKKQIREYYQYLSDDLLNKIHILTNEKNQLEIKTNIFNDCIAEYQSKLTSETKKANKYDQSDAEKILYRLENHHIYFSKADLEDLNKKIENLTKQMNDYYAIIDKSY